MYLSNNQLTGAIPSQLGNLTNLQRLYLNNNQLSGSIPTQLGNLASLASLNLRDNGLTGCVPETLQRIAAIQDDLTSLGLPRCHADLAALTALYEATNGANWTNRTNWFTYSPFADWHGVTTDESGRVTSLNFYYNGLSGTIPAEISGLTDLTSLRISNNALTGTIPSQLGNLTNLTSLDLVQNQLSGAIPTPNSAP